MIDALFHIFIFAIDVIILAIAIIIVFAAIVGIAAKSKPKEKLQVVDLNAQYTSFGELLTSEQQSKKEKKLAKKSKKKVKKQPQDKSTIYVLDFVGDIKASQTSSLSTEISAIIQAAKKNDEVFIRLESPGGLVHSYGLAAAELERLKSAGLTLTIAVDKMAASGGYMMACVADKIIASPFAIIGSIGVLLQMPNFNKLLKKHEIDFEQLSAGEFKRTLTLFGENDDKKREKMQEDINETHELFKQHVSSHRPLLDMQQVATGEYWYGQRAKALGLVDTLQTSEAWLLDKTASHHLRLIQRRIKKPVLQKILHGAEAALIKLFSSSKLNHIA